MPKSPLEQIAEYKAKIAELEEAAITELKERANALQQELAGIHQEIKRITGSSAAPIKARKRRAGTKAVGSTGGNKADVADAKELKKILSGVEGKRLTRKGFIDAGYSLKSAIAVAKTDKDTFGFKQNGPQGEVWLK